MNAGSRVLIAASLLVGALWLGAQTTPGEPQAPVPAKRAIPDVKTPNWTYEQVEALYLAGDISARHLQQFIVALEAREPIPAPPIVDAVHVRAIGVLRDAKPDPNQNPPPGPAVRPDQLPGLTPLAPPEEDPIEKEFVEIEAKVDELLRLKTSREKGEVKGPPMVLDPSRPKRERLDALLRWYIQGKISEEDYNAKRSAIIAEADK